MTPHLYFKTKPGVLGAKSWVIWAIDNIAISIFQVDFDG